MNYIIWKDKDSREINGLLISELPPITKPNMRVNETVVDGVDGSIIEELGYESYDRTIIIALKVGADIDEIISYFTGSGDIYFSNEPDKYYKARIIKNIDYERLLRYRVAKVTFRVQPFKYRNEDYCLWSGSDEKKMIVTNNGNYTSKPFLYIIGSGTVALSVNGDAVCRYTFPDGEDTVMLDCENQEAIKGYSAGATLYRNRNMIGEFPIFQAGENVITWGGSVSTIIVMNYSRWL